MRCRWTADSDVVAALVAHKVYPLHVSTSVSSVISWSPEPESAQTHNPCCLENWANNCMPTSC